jgi:hypothetical protein
MRPLCGAIITAGALIGLGLTALGFGTRYGQIVTPDRNAQGEVIQLHLSQMDKPLVFVLVVLSAVALIGLGMTFVGLAYHHHKRTLEHHHLMGNHEEHQPPMRSVG